jgi:hypothetical protein
MKDLQRAAESGNWSKMASQWSGTPDIIACGTPLRRVRQNGFKNEHRISDANAVNGVPCIPEGLKEGDVVKVQGSCGPAGEDRVCVVVDIIRATGIVHVRFDGHGVTTAKWQTMGTLWFSVRGDRLIKQSQQPNTRLHRQSERTAYLPGYWRNLANGTP